MTEQAETAEPTTETVVTKQEAPEEEPFDKARAMGLIEKLRRENRELDKARKRLEVLEKAEQERQDAELSETERLKKQLAEIQTEAATLKLRDMQRQAAEKAGIPMALAERLRGATPEELEADAAELAKTLPPKTPPPVATTNPGANAKGGETDAQRRARLYGQVENIFDPQVAAQHGGGVHFRTQE